MNFIQKIKKNITDNKIAYVTAGAAAAGVVAGVVIAKKLGVSNVPFGMVAVKITNPEIVPTDAIILDKIGVEMMAKGAFTLYPNVSGETYAVMTADLLKKLTSKSVEALQEMYDNQK